MNVRSENLANAASAVEDAIHGKPGLMLSKHPELREAINALSEALTEFRRWRNEEEEKFFKLAKSQYQSDGDLEFDQDAIVSISEDNGAYVQGWKWVDDES